MGIFDFADGIEKDIGEFVDGATDFAGDALDRLGFDGAGRAVKDFGDAIANSMGAMPDEKELGDTDDPRELVFGDPSAIRSHSTTIAGFGRNFDTAGSGLKGMSTGHWTGEGADGYEQATAIEWPKWSTAADAAGTAAGALTTWAADVEFAQRKAAEAIALWQEAERKGVQWRAEANRKIAEYNRDVNDFNNGDSMAVPVKPDLGTDPEPAGKAEARRVLKVGRDHRNQAASGIKSTLDGAANMAPPMPSTAEQIAGDAKDMYEGANIAKNHLDGGVVSAVTQTVKVIRTVDPTNPYNVANPGQYVQNVARVAAGVTHQLANPADFVRNFVGSGWSSDPAQSAGALAANLGMAVAPGPKGVSALSAATKVAGKIPGVKSLKEVLPSAAKGARVAEHGAGSVERGGAPASGVRAGDHAGDGVGSGGSHASPADHAEPVQPVATHHDSPAPRAEPAGSGTPESPTHVAAHERPESPAGQQPGSQETPVPNHDTGGSHDTGAPHDTGAAHDTGVHHDTHDSSPAISENGGGEGKGVEKQVAEDQAAHHPPTETPSGDRPDPEPRLRHDGADPQPPDGIRDTEMTPPRGYHDASPDTRGNSPTEVASTHPADTHPATTLATPDHSPMPVSPTRDATPSVMHPGPTTHPGVTERPDAGTVAPSHAPSNAPSRPESPAVTRNDRSPTGHRDTAGAVRGGFDSTPDAAQRTTTNPPLGQRASEPTPRLPETPAHRPGSDNDGAPRIAPRKPTDDSALMVNHGDGKQNSPVGGGGGGRPDIAGASGARAGGSHGGGGHHEPPHGDVNGETGTAHDPAHPGRVNDGAGENAQRPAGNEEPQNCTRDGEPVNVATGEYFLPMTDVDLPGVLPLRLTHQHRSRYRWGMWFGPSAVGTFDTRLIIDDDGVTSVDADGTMLRFGHPQPDSPVRATHGRDWELSLTGTGGYRLRQLDTETSYYFEPKPGLDGADVRGGTIMISAIMDRHLNRILFSWNENGRPVGVEHSAGYRVEVTADGARILGYRLVAGLDGAPVDQHLRTFSYHDGHLAAVRNAVGATTFFRHDDAGRMVSWRDSLGQEYWNRYDDLGRVVRQSGVDGVWAGTFSYRQFADGAGSVTMYTDAIGGVTTYGMDRDGRVRRVIDPMGRETATDYNASRDPLRRVASDGATTRFRYTDQGDLAEVIDPSGAVTRVHYVAAHRPNVVVAADGARTTYDYDARGNIASITDNASGTKHFSYDDTGSVTSVVDADGVVARYENNGAGLPMRVIDAFGSVTEVSYDPAGRVIAVVDAEGNETTVTYDVEGRRTAETDAAGAIQRWTYDGEGNCLAHTDAVCAVTRWEYGYFDLPVARIDADGSRTTFAYDAARRLVSVTNPANLEWRYEYNLDGTLAVETDFNGATTTYTYDDAGRMAYRRNAAGQSLAFTYDPCGRVVRESSTGDDSSMPNESIDYTYDAVGRLVDTRGAFGRWQAEYGRAGMPTAFALNDNRIDVDWTPGGLLASVITPAGMRTDYGYDVRGVLDSVTAAGRVCQFSTDRSGRETRRRFDGAAIDSVWDQVGRLVGRSVVSNPVDPSALSLGPSVGRIESEVEAAGFEYRGDGALVRSSGSAGDVRYALDQLGRVAERVVGDGSEAYRFDRAGNVSAVDGPAVPGSAGWSFSGTLLLDDGRSSYRYDAAGRLVSTVTKRLSRRPDVWRYRWDAWDRLREVTVPDGRRFAYAYDHAGRRVSKTDVASGVVTRFGWLGDQLVEQSVVSAAGAVGESVSWVFAPGGVVPVGQVHSSGGGVPVSDSGSVSVVDTGLLNLGAGVRRSASSIAPRVVDDQSWVDAEFSALVCDQVSSPVALVDPVSARVVGRAVGSVWGLVSWSGSVSTPWRFPGQYFDDESGLHYNRFRYYQPGVGRYVSPDPLGLLPSPNPYGYPGNPTVVCDPLGLAPTEGCGANGTGASQFSSRSEPGSGRLRFAGRGSTGDMNPENLAEQIAMKAAQTDPFRGRMILARVHDPRWSELGWTKNAQNFEAHDVLGFIQAIEIHYLVNPLLGLVDDFKFIRRSGTS